MLKNKLVIRRLSSTERRPVQVLVDDGSVSEVNMETQAELLGLSSTEEVM